MKLRSQMLSNLRDITFASRMFLAVAVVALCAAVAVLAYHQGAFTRTIRVFIYAGTADGMHKGMAVKLVGFRVGAVDDISIDNDLRVRVALKIDRKYVPMIDADATVRLLRETLIGGNILEVRTGSGDRGPITPRAILRYERELSLDGSLSALVDQITPIAGDIKQITSFLASPEGDFRQAIGNANRAAAALVETRAEVGQLIAALTAGVEKGEKRAVAVLDTTDALLREARMSVAMLDGSLKKIDAALPGIASKMDQSLENIRVTSEAMRGMVTGEMPGMVGEAGALVSDTADVVRGARRSWPVRALVPPQREMLLRLDSGGGLKPVPVDGARD